MIGWNVLLVESSVIFLGKWIKMDYIMCKAVQLPVWESGDGLNQFFFTIHSWTQPKALRQEV